MQVTYAIVFVQDMPRSVAFYRDVLGLPLRFESTHWTEFATDGATVALHKAEARRPGDPAPTDERAGQCRPGFGVPDLDVFHARMIARGVTCVEPPKNVFGARQAQYADPDGLVISVGEPGPA